MGQLLHVEDLKPDPSWHLQTARLAKDNRGNERWVFDFENEPHLVDRCAIHQEVFNRNSDVPQNPRITVRRWIEHNLPDTVILHHQSMSYHYFYEYEGRNRHYDSITERSHGYYFFGFESSASAILFRLTFSSMITTPNVFHPDHIGKTDVRMRISGHSGYLDGNGNLHSF
jgi:hypothetical protein